MKRRGTARGITDGEKAMIGGMITAKNVKYTKTEQSDGISNGGGSVRKCRSHCVSAGV